MNAINENIINAKGKIDYTFTNDFVFRAILQRNKNVLTELICSLLHLQLMKWMLQSRIRLN